MATLPRFTFPLREQHNTLPLPDSDNELIGGMHGDTTPRRERPRIPLRTPSGEREGYRFSVPEIPWVKRPDYMRAMCTTPPDSPTRTRAYTMDSSTHNAKDMISKIDSRCDNGAMTPPATPTRSRHTSSFSNASIKSTFDSLRAPVPAGPGPAAKEKARSDELIDFPYWITDYEVVRTDRKGTKKLLGSGVWSDVYHAVPTFPTSSPSSSASDTSPPATPHSRSSSTSTTAMLPNLPSAYAIKTPSSAAAQKVLTEEARIVSYLSRLPGSEKHIVTFYGQDSRTGALVLKLMDGTLEDWINKTLSTLPEAQRATKLAEVFPGIAKQLLDGLTWLKQHGCVHADVKPANILVSTMPGSSVPQVVFTDFSSAILSSATPLSSPPSLQGGGTWDFLEPHFLSVATKNATPTASADLWATAITLLTIVIGGSPYDFLGNNVFQRRECIKQGTPIPFVGYGDFAARNVARLKGVSGGIGVDFAKWLKKVLVKEAEDRVDVEGFAEGLFGAETVASG